jgi:hypothetical protein
MSKIAPLQRPDAGVGVVRGAGEGSDRSEGVKHLLELFLRCGAGAKRWPARIIWRVPWPPEAATTNRPRAQRAMTQARQATRHTTLAAPASCNSRAQALAVAPEVNTSSTRTTVRSATAAGRRTANALATLISRESTRGSPWGRVGRSRTKAPGATANPRRRATSLASQAAWSNPRWRRRLTCKGTETRTHRRILPRVAVRGPSAAAMLRARNRPAPRSESSLKRLTMAPPTPR